MTPYQFNRLNGKQRVLAGLGTLGFIQPSGWGLALPNNALTVKSATGAVVGTAALPTPFKTSSTLKVPSMTSTPVAQLDYRNADASVMLQRNATTAKGALIAAQSAAVTNSLAKNDKVSSARILPDAAVFNPPPVPKEAPGSVITPTTQGTGGNSTNWGNGTPSIDYDLPVMMPPGEVAPNGTTGLVPVPNAVSRPSTGLIVAGVAVVGVLGYLFFIR